MDAIFNVLNSPIFLGIMAVIFICGLIFVKSKVKKDDK